MDEQLTYDFLLKDRGRTESFLFALLPAESKPPDADELQRRLASLPLVDARVTGNGSGEELLASFAFERGGRPTAMRVRAGQTTGIDEIHAERMEIPPQVLEEARRSRTAVGVCMTFGAQPLADFHRQIRVLSAAAPEALLVVDSSACRLHTSAWLRETAASPVPPSPDFLFVVHAVYDPKVPKAATWLHTHGLHRCGSIELEMMDVPRDEAGNLGRLLNVVAALFIEEGCAPPGRPFEPGRDLPLAWLPWEQGLRKVSGGLLGGRGDRDAAHSVPSGILFAPARGLFGTRYRSPAVHAPALNDNPLLYVSAMETERMTLLARDRMPTFAELQRKHGASDEWKFLVKLGYPIDGAKRPTDREHLWFEVHALREVEVEATLVNAPYAVARLKEGDRGTHPLELLSDWSILHREWGVFPPDALHILHQRMAKG